MRVKVGNEWHDSRDIPVAVEISPEERLQIERMEGATRYAQSSRDWSDSEFADWLASEGDPLEPEPEPGLEFLRELGGEMRSENDDHATAFPIYLVQQKARIFGVDTSYRDPDGHVLMHEGEVFEPEPGETLPPDVECVGYVERWELVEGAVAFTRRGIERYLKSNRHNLNEPRIWIGSISHRADETRTLYQVLRRMGSQESRGKTDE